MPAPLEKDEVMPLARAISVQPNLRAMALLCLFPVVAQAGAQSPAGQEPQGAVLVRFDETLQETRVSAKIAPGSCLSLTLPKEWRLGASADRLRLEAASLNAAIEIAVRSARDLKDLPQPNLADRDAAFLQRTWEAALGRPAQSVSVAFPMPGTLRWTATWFDARFPAPSQSMTIDTFIIPLTQDWVIELFPTDIVSPEAYEPLTRQVIAGLKTSATAQCED